MSHTWCVRSQIKTRHIQTKHIDCIYSEIQLRRWPITSQAKFSYDITWFCLLIQVNIFSWFFYFQRGNYAGKDENRLFFKKYQHHHWHTIFVLFRMSAVLKYLHLKSNLTNSHCSHKINIYWITWNNRDL